jgi:hypothetical protein
MNPETRKAGIQKILLREEKIMENKYKWPETKSDWQA